VTDREYTGSTIFLLYNIVFLVCWCLHNFFLATLNIGIVWVANWFIDLLLIFTQLIWIIWSILWELHV